MTSIRKVYRVCRWLFTPGAGLTRLLPFVLLVGLIVSPVPALAKRTPAPVVEPVIYQGVRYVVPNDKGTVGYVQAWDVATAKKLWQKKIFRKCLIPLLEPDVQWVFIKRMWREDNRLVLLDETKRTYVLDLKTRKVKRLKQVQIR